MREILPVTIHIALLLIFRLSVRLWTVFDLEQSQLFYFGVVRHCAFFTRSIRVVCDTPRRLCTENSRLASMLRVRFYNHQWFVFTKVHREFFHWQEWVGINAVYLELYLSSPPLKLVIIYATHKKCCRWKWSSLLGAPPICLLNMSVVSMGIQSSILCYKYLYISKIGFSSCFLN